MKPAQRTGRRAPAWAQWCATALLTFAAATAHAQYANADMADWKEDTVPPPPAFSLSGLIDIEMPRGSSVKMGVDPKTIALNHDTGIVRYVVVARGPSAVNATYEGIRCATGEFRIYARKVQDGEWTPSTETEWKSMMGQSNIMVRHPLQLARGGMCLGSTLRRTAKEIVRELQTGNQSLYY